MLSRFRVWIPRTVGSVASGFRVMKSRVYRYLLQNRSQNVGGRGHKSESRVIRVNSSVLSELDELFARLRSVSAELPLEEAQKLNAVLDDLDRLLPPE